LRRLPDPNSEPRMGGVSEIPIGSPPAPPGRHAAPSGWYPDPASAAQERYWDGWQWSRNTRPRAHSTPQPVSPYRPSPSRATVRTADGVPLAGWWWRALAVIIDSLILAVVGAILLAPIYLRFIRAMSEAIAAAARAARAGQPSPALTPTDLLSARDQLLVTGVTVGLALAYTVMFLRWKGATPGKLVCGLRVVPVDQGLSRARLPWQTVLVRAAIWVLPGLFSLLAVITVIDALFPLWNPKRQALHDLVARTQVVAVR
jgi:uncharacterized RDD family membrane protein YckC